MAASETATRGAFLASPGGEGRDSLSESSLPRLLILDVSKPGGAGATGQLSRTLFGDWPKGSLLHLHWEGTWPWRLFDGEGTELVKLDAVAQRCRAFRPEVIYYRPVPFPMSFHQMAMSLIEELGCPFVVHLMDDWLKRLETLGDESYALFEASVRALLRSASQRFSICDAMSEAFESRFGMPFVTVSNGIDLRKMGRAAIGSGGRHPFTIRYCGGLANDMTRQSVKLLGEAVGALQGERSARLEVYTKSHYDLNAAQDLIGLPGVVVRESVPDSEYDELLRSADALVIAYNFDRLSCDYVRYSFANKLPECMASGSPILAFGPTECASIRFLIENECALVVDENDPSKLGQAIERLIDDSDLRLRISRQAMEVCRRRFSLDEERMRLQAYLREASKGEAAAVASEGLCPFPPPVSVSHSVEERVRFDERGFLLAAVSKLGSGRNGSRSESPSESNLLFVEDASSGLGRLREKCWELDFPEGIMVSFDDRKSETSGCNMHQLAVFLRRSGYTVLVSEWHPLGLGGEASWRRLSPYPSCLASPLAWGSLLAIRGELDGQQLAEATEEFLIKER